MVPRFSGTTATNLKAKSTFVRTRKTMVFEFPEDFVRRLSAAQPEAIPGRLSGPKHDEMVHMGADGPAIEAVVGL